jgi:hypothetical protein
MRRRAGRAARIALAAVVLGILVWAAAGYGGDGSARATPVRWKECPGRSDLRTRSLSCATARRVLRDFFDDRPKIDPGPSPAGWACRQRQGDHTSDGGVVLDDVCHSVRDPGRRLHLVWTTGVSTDRRLG